MTVSIRSFTSADLADVVSLWNGSMVADPINPHRLTLDFLLDPHFDPDLFLVACDGDEPIGFVLALAAKAGMSSENPVGNAAIVAMGVHDRHLRQGVGTPLIEGLEQALGERNVSRIQVGPWIPTYLMPGVDESAYPAASEFFASHGYKTGDKPISMRADLTGYVPAEGIQEIAARLASERVEIRPAEFHDAVPLIAFADTHFPHWTNYVRRNLVQMVEANPESSLHLAVAGGEIIGFALTNGERFGPFGVNEAWRGNGVGAVLLSRALCAMRSANIHTAWFLWTSEQTARLYHRHGFEIVRRFTMTSKHLSRID